MKVILKKRIMMLELNTNLMEGSTMEESNLIKHARHELELAGAFDKEKDFYGGMTGGAVMELIKVFSGQGHSGMSASIVRNLFNKVANYEPLLGLTGEDDEWNEVGKGVFQNKRCSRVFKENGEAYDIDGKVFVEAGGASYTNGDSRTPVTFPYTPKTEYHKNPAIDIID